MTQHGNKRAPWIACAALVLAACQPSDAEPAAVSSLPDDLPPLTEAEPPTLAFTVDAIRAEPGASGRLARDLLAQGPLDAEATEALAAALQDVGDLTMATEVRQARREQADVSPDEQRYPLLALAHARGSEALGMALEIELSEWSVDGTALTQEGLEAFLRIANEAQGREPTEHALRALAHALGGFRQDGATDGVIKEVRRLTLPSAVAARAGVDYRFVPPWLELLVDLGDVAGIARVTAGYTTGRAAEVLARYATMVAFYEGSAILDTTQAGCEVVIDGEPQPHGELALLPGSHEVGCAGEAWDMLVVAPDERVTWSP